MLPKNPGLSRAAALDVPSGFGGKYAETDESHQTFVPCGFCCPGAEREAMSREKFEKVVFRHFFDTLKRSGNAYGIPASACQKS